MFFTTTVSSLWYFTYHNSSTDFRHTTELLAPCISLELTAKTSVQINYCWLLAF